MQATGMVNDHLVSCHRLRAVRKAAAHLQGARSDVAHDGQGAAATPEAAARAWQRMLSGRRLDLLDPSPADIEIEDIAHGLARVARWNGQTRRRSCLLGGAARAAGRGDRRRHRIPAWTARWRLAALLHDAPEYVIGDLISPFKAAIGLDYKAFEMRLLRGDPSPLRPAGDAAGPPSRPPSSTPTASPPSTRQPVLAGFSLEEADRFFGEPASSPANLLHDRWERSCRSSAGAAQAAFLARFTHSSESRAVVFSARTAP